MPTSTRPRSPYDRGPWRAREIPGLVLGTAIVAGGTYGLVRLLEHHNKAQQAANSPIPSAPLASYRRRRAR